MTWTRAFVYVAIWLVLAAYYAATHHPPPPQPDRAPAPVAAVRPSPPPVPYLAVRPAEVTDLELQVRGRRLHARRAGARWEIVEPVGAQVAGDLVGALLGAIYDLPEVEVVGDRMADDDAFGLADPSYRVTVRRADGPPLSLAFGTKNPAGTAIYAGGDGSPTVVLLGLNAQYYIDMLMRQAGGP